jgi:hypothetical protein
VNKITPDARRNYYQLAFVTPGISPREANSLKHILQSLNLLMKPRGLPHNMHLL